jgi:hypothetical protein
MWFPIRLPPSVKVTCIPGKRDKGDLLMNQEIEREKRKAKRMPLDTKVEFIVDADVIQAKSIDMSETGIRIETDDPIKICMRLDIDGEKKDMKGQLVWTRKNEKGGMIYGFQYIRDPDREEL